VALTVFSRFLDQPFISSDLVQRLRRGRYRAPSCHGESARLGVTKRVDGEPVTVPYHSHFLFPTSRHLPDAKERGFKNVLSVLVSEANLTFQD
jgi:hypothetical protein